MYTKFLLGRNTFAQIGKTVNQLIQHQNPIILIGLQNSDQNQKCLTPSS